VSHSLKTAGRWIAKARKCDSKTVMANPVTAMPYREQKNEGSHIGLVLMLWYATCLNYMVRTSLSIAAPTLSGELGLSPAQVGVLLSSFSWLYVSFMVVAGWLADRFNPAHVLGIGLLLWSVAALATGFAEGLKTLLACRLLLGFGESFAFPAIYKIIGSTFPAHRRAVPNSLVDVGGRMGAGLSVLLGGLLIARFGWRNIYLFLGLANLVWLVPWFWSSPEHKKAVTHIEPNGPRIKDILKRRQAWGTFLGNFCSNYVYFFLLAWLPSYLIMARHLSISKTAFCGSLPYVTGASASFLGGWMSDRWVRRGASETRVRKGFMIFGCLASAVVLPAYLVESLTVAIIFLSVAYLAIGMAAANIWAITQTMAGPAAGRWIGLQNTAGNLPGIVAPLVTGFIVSKSGSFFWAFLSAAIIGAIGAMFYGLLVGEVRPLEWANLGKTADKQQNLSDKES
jgi:ACS family D-galactonate transporter-like MFS transporter